MKPLPRKPAILVALVGESKITRRFPPGLPATSVPIPDSRRPDAFSPRAHPLAAAVAGHHRRRRAYSTTEVQPNPARDGVLTGSAPPPMVALPAVAEATLHSFLALYPGNNLCKAGNSQVNLGNQRPPRRTPLRSGSRPRRAGGSFAGQQDTYLNVVGPAAILQ